MTDAIKPYLARSGALHALFLIGFALYVPSALKKADKVYMIDFVGGPPVIQSAGPTAPAQPTAETAPPAPQQQAEKDTFAVKGRHAIALPRPSLLKGWTEHKALSRPSLSPTPQSEVTGAPGAAAGMPGEAAGVATDLPNFPYPWYISQVRQMLWSAWQKKMPGASGEGVVVFAIMRNGAYTDLRMESSSGDNAFDTAAVESVQAASPFPALPSDFKEPFLKIHLTLKSEPSWR
jgi:TonB family protein